MAILEQLAAHEADEMDLIIDVKGRQNERGRLRAAMLAVDEDRVAVRARIHLLDQEVERPLRKRLVALEDELALLRHARLDTEQLANELARATEQRAIAAAFLDERTPVLDTTIGRPPAGGADWSLADVPVSMLDDAARCCRDLRAGLVGAVDTVVDSELLALRLAGDRPDGMVELDLTDHDPDAVAQVAAFVADVRMIGAVAEQVAARLRLAALRASVDRPSDWRLAAGLRRRHARHALDYSRAVHAALAEVNKLAELNE